MFKKCECLGIEVRHTKDYTTKLPKDVYYFHGKVLQGAEAVDGIVTFSAKVPDNLVSLLAVGETYLIAYSTYNGYNSIQDVIVR